MKFLGFLGKITSAFILSLIFLVPIGIYALIKKTIAFTGSLFSPQHPIEILWIDKKVRPATVEELKRKY